jgi:hypothetical protein
LDVAGGFWNDRIRLGWYFERDFAKMLEISWFLVGQNVVKCVVNVVEKLSFLSGEFGDR